MAHAHDHAAENNYFLDQLCSVAACAALGVISILMYVTGKLMIILAPQFHIPVLVGGIAILAMALYRGIDLWKQAGAIVRQRQEHEHDHDHHHHDHNECDHQHADCGHDHSHSWMPVKYAFLLLPIVLFLLGLPHAGFSNDMIKRLTGTGELEGGPKEVANKGTDLSLGFRELSEAAHSESKQQALEGKTVKLRGMFMRLRGDKEFTLFKIRMRCCAADAIPMQVRIFSPVPLNQFQDREWVEVKGQLQFVKLAGQQKVIPVVVVESGDDIRKIPPEPTEFDY
jgi:uncharacterized repeat protein (TIGR03943 family)